MISDIPGISDRRQSPRYKITLVVDLVLANGNMLTVNTRNISSSGLQIICDSWITDEIEPRGIQSYAVNHLRIKTITDLLIENETENKTKKLYANCRIMSVQRKSQNQYMLNLAFIDFENGSEKVLDEFLAQYVQKKTVINAIA